MSRVALLALLLLAPAAARADEGPPPLPHEAAVAGALSARVREVLRAPDRLELFALLCERAPDPGEATFQEEYPVVRAVTAEGAAARAEVVDAVYAGIAAGGALAMCFEPHHGLRATRGAVTVELLVCYTCAQVRVREPGHEDVTVVIGREGEAVLNRALGQATTVPADLVRGRTLAEWRGALEAERRGGAAAPSARGSEVVEAVGELLEWGTTQVARTEETPDGASITFATEYEVRVTDALVRRAAADLLGGLGGAWAAPAARRLAIAAAVDGDDAVRAACARTVAAFEGEALGEAAGGALEVVHERGVPDAPRVRALALLGALGPAAAAARAELLEVVAEVAGDEDEPAEVRAAAAAALRRLRP